MMERLTAGRYLGCTDGEASARDYGLEVKAIYPQIRACHPPDKGRSLALHIDTGVMSYDIKDTDGKPARTNHG